MNCISIRYHLNIIYTKRLLSFARQLPSQAIPGRKDAKPEAGQPQALRIGFDFFTAGTSRKGG
jgi:hypothetical protein